MILKKQFRFMESRGIFFTISGLMIFASLGSIFFKGFNEGIDFTGGLTAHLSINFEKSDITMVRGLFTRVEFDKKEADGKTVKIIENLGMNITQLEAKEPLGYEHQTYLIRIKNIPGVEKEQIEQVLPTVLAGQFSNRTMIGFAAEAVRADDDGVALAGLLAEFGIAPADIKRSVPEEGGMPLFTVARIFPGMVNETEFRNGITRVFLATPAYTLTEEVSFVSTLDWGSFNSMSSTIGDEVRESAIVLAIAVILAMLVYIAVRFDYKFGVGAITALVHDVVIMLGVLSLTGRELNIPVVAAVLTVIGYSINDTIVIFDRIRENLAFSRREDMPALINNSINQTLSRTIITSLTTLLAVVSIFLFAGEVLRDFSFLLIIGLVVGTFSSLGIASPIYLALEQRALRRELEKKGGKKHPAPA